MKRYFICTVLILCMGSVCLAQAGAPFNVEKSRQEFEIMKGILSTSIAYSLSGESSESPWFRSSNIDAFYLSGQGAVFEIPAYSFQKPSELPFSESAYSQAINAYEEYAELFSKQMELQAEQLAKRAQELNQNKPGIGGGIGSGSGGGIGGGIGGGQGTSATPPQPPAAPAPPALPAPPAPPVSKQELSDSLEEVKAAVNKRKEKMEARQAEYEQNLEKAKSQLIETLANYGDSLTTVKPDEYINLILTSSDYTVGAYNPATGRQATREVISVRKSWITDYKTGKLSLDGFKQKALQYSN